MLALSDDIVILRDFIQADIEDYVHWETVETEWKLWDAPWEHMGQTDAQRAAALADDVAWMRGHAREVALLRDDAPRRRFEVCVLDGGEDPLDGGGAPLRGEGHGRTRRFHSGEEGLPPALHIGGVSTYRIDDDFSIAKDGRISPWASTSTACRRVVTGMRFAPFGCSRSICLRRGRRSFTVKHGPAMSA